MLHRIGSASGRSRLSVNVTLLPLALASHPASRNMQSRMQSLPLSARRLQSVHTALAAGAGLDGGIRAFGNGLPDFGQSVSAASSPTLDFGVAPHGGVEGATVVVVTTAEGAASGLGLAGAQAADFTGAAGTTLVTCETSARASIPPPTRVDLNLDSHLSLGIPSAGERAAASTRQRRRSHASQHTVHSDASWLLRSICGRCVQTAATRRRVRRGSSWPGSGRLRRWGPPRSRRRRRRRSAR